MCAYNYIIYIICRNYPTEQNVMVSMGAVSHVCTNSCDRVRDVLILGTGYSDIVSVSLSLLLSDWPLVRAHFRLFCRVYFATPTLAANVLYACVHRGCNIFGRIWYIRTNENDKERKGDIQGLD